MASTPLPIPVPSLSFSFLSLSSLSASPLGFCRVVLFRKGQVKQEKVTISPTHFPLFLSTSLPPSFLPTLLPTFYHPGPDPPMIQKDLPPTIPGHLPFILGGPTGEDLSSSECYRQVLSEDCTGASFQSSQSPTKETAMGMSWSSLGTFCSFQFSSPG